MSLRGERHVQDLANALIVNKEAQHLVKLGQRMQKFPQSEKVRKEYIEERRRIFSEGCKRIFFDHEEVFLVTGKYLKGIINS